MPVCSARAALVVLTLLASPADASADELADFNAAVERASAHNRVAIGYLRTGNIDLASLEIDRMRHAWSAVVSRFGGKRPAAFKDQTQFTTVMTDVNVRLVTASMFLGSGRPDNAAQSLSGIRTELSRLRRSNGVTVLADCIGDANAAMDALIVYDTRALDWSKAETRSGLAKSASDYDAVLVRCDGMADAEVRQSPEFRRLVDGARASLALIPKAIEARDGGLLHRVLIELRSFDNLLAFRFG